MIVHLILLIVVLPIVTTNCSVIKDLKKDDACKCPKGWIPKSKGCYKALDGKYIHTEGSSACKALHSGSHLPILVDKEDMDDINAVRKSHNINEWIWLDGDDLLDPGKYMVGSYLNQNCELPFKEGWGLGEPDNKYKREDCLAISSWVGYKMADGDCNVSIPVICQIPFLNACKPDEVITSLCRSTSNDERVNECTTEAEELTVTAEESESIKRQVATKLKLETSSVRYCVVVSKTTFIIIMKVEYTSLLETAIKDKELTLETISGKTVVVSDIEVSRKVSKSQKRLITTAQQQSSGYLKKDYTCRCPKGWIPKSKGCYKALDRKYNHTEGSSACKALHSESNLPILIDTEDMDDLNAVRRSHNINEWIWLDGDDLLDPGKYMVGSYLNQACELPFKDGWGLGEPDNKYKLEDCLAISSWVGYKMADGNCKVMLPVICQIPFLNACKPDEMITSLCRSDNTMETNNAPGTTGTA